MRTIMKKRLAVFLSILFVLPAVMSVLPMAKQEVSAASYIYMTIDKGDGSYANTHTIEVEQGQKFYIGDYVSIQTEQNGRYCSYTASMVKASYSSAKTSVASVKKNGYLTAKKTGTADISVKYKGQKVTITLKVVKSGSLGGKKAVKELQKAVKEMSKSFPTKITTKNGYAVYQRKSAYAKTASAEEISDTVSDKGYLKKKVNSGYGYDYLTVTNKLAVPQAGRYNTLTCLLNDYAQRNSPTSTRSAKCLNITGVSAKTNSLTLTFKKKVDAAHILAAGILSYSNDALSKTEASSYVEIYDVTAQKYLYGNVKLKKGSNKAAVQLESPLIKGHTYRLGKADQWTKGKTFKVK